MGNAQRDNCLARKELRRLGVLRANTYEKGSIKGHTLSSEAQRAPVAGSFSFGGGSGGRSRDDIDDRPEADRCSVAGTGGGRWYMCARVNVRCVWVAFMGCCFACGCCFVIEAARSWSPRHLVLPCVVLVYRARSSHQEWGRAREGATRGRWSAGG